MLPHPAAWILEDSVTDVDVQASLGVYDHPGLVFGRQVGDFKAFLVASVDIDVCFLAAETSSSRVILGDEDGVGRERGAGVSRDKEEVLNRKRDSFLGLVSNIETDGVELLLAGAAWAQTDLWFRRGQSMGSSIRNLCFHRWPASCPSSRA